MKLHDISRSLGLSGAIFLGTTSLVQGDCTEDAMIVFDGSGSMAEMGYNLIDEPRIFEARRAVRQAMPELEPNRRIGLIVYGPDIVPESCAGVTLRFAPKDMAAQSVIEAIDTLQPDGNTALTEAVALAAKVLDYRNAPATIVLISDGKETCGGAPCALAQQLYAQGKATTVHVIGFKVRGEHFNWPDEDNNAYTRSVSVAKCLSTQTGGEYVDAETVEDLIAAMNRTLGCNVLF